MKNVNINTGKNKTFGDLQPGADKIYFVNPESGSIVESEIASVKELKRNGKWAVLQFEVYKLFAFDSITTEKLKEAKKENNSKVTWTIRVLNQEAVGLINLPKISVPIPIASDKDGLIRWMTLTGPNKKKTIY